MLINHEINRILNNKNKKIRTFDEDVFVESKKWETNKSIESCRIIAEIYLYLKDNKEIKCSLGELQPVFDVHYNRISMSLRALEKHGYISIDRTSSPYIYRNIK